MAKKVDILIITNKQVIPATDGGALAMKKLSSILNEKKYSINMVCISKNNKSIDILKTTSLISETFKQVVFQKNMKFNLINFMISIIKNTSYQASRFYDYQIQKHIQDSIDKKKYRIIIFESIFACIYLEKLNIPRDTKTVFRAHNIEHKIWTDLANSSFKKILYKLLARQIKKMEMNVPKKMNYILTLSQNDKKFFYNLFPNKTYNLPVHFTVKNHKTQKIKNSIFHLGAMDWKPNAEGINWFLNQVAPLVHKKTRIYIAGKGIGSKYNIYKKDNILIEGKIKDANDYIASKEILFVPIFSGSGIRIKILEAMAMGIPVISTKHGAVGIPYINGYNILIADTVKDFAQAINKLVRNKQLAKKIGNNGKKIIQKHFSKNYVSSKWEKIIN
ncbi:MAG: hypothetical protein CMD26_01735 [Flavobacteriales bacterium]|nr:hypothetical protein [Flavobacteriales bacterium]|tara:strand:+ start:89 stop:1258 length:1170 start_codon:yes stop_codon:yes gene_type:complete